MARWWRSATSIAISSRIEPPGWMIAVTPAPAAAWMPSGNGKYASEAMTESLRPVAGPPDGDLDRDLAARLARADADRGAIAREDDRVRADVADRAPREEQVGQLLERRAALRDDLEPAAVEPELVQALDEQAAGDALEVEAGDAVVAHALGRVGRDRQQLEAGLAAQDADRRLAEPGRDDRLVRVGRDLARRRAVELPVDADDPAERRDRIGLEGVPVGLDQLVVRGEARPDRCA